MRISEELVLGARSCRTGSSFHHQRRRNFFQEIQFLMPRCMRKLNFDDDVSLLSGEENDIGDDTTYDLDEITSDYEENVSDCFQPKILNAISSAAWRFVISPTGSPVNKSRSTSKRLRQSVIHYTLCCHSAIEDEHYARINDWVLSSTICEKQTPL